MFRILVSCGKGWADPDNPVPKERKEKKSTEPPVEEAENLTPLTVTGTLIPA